MNKQNTASGFAAHHPPCCSSPPTGSTVFVVTNSLAQWNEMPNKSATTHRTRNNSVDTGRISVRKIHSKACVDPDFHS
jgi:hypothetical protein